jgi:hypothetical protein
VAPPAGHHSPPPAAEVIHVAFGSHYVVVRSVAPDLMAELRDALGPMAVEEPAGSCAGHVDALPEAGEVRIVGAPDAGATQRVSRQWAPRELYHAAVKLLMLARDDLIWTHAGVAALGERAFMFCGPSGQGKSTLVAALLARGWTYFSDEIAAIDASSGAVHPFPLAPRRRVHDGDFVPLDDGDAIRTLRKEAVDFPAHAVGARPLPLERIYFLHYAHAAGSIDVVPCPPAQSVLTLLRNSLSITADREREIARLAQLASRVPAVQIRYHDAAAAAAHVHTDVASHLALSPTSSA